MTGITNPDRSRKDVARGGIAVSVPIWINVRNDDHGADDLIAFLHGAGRSPSDTIHPVQVVAFARHFDPLVSPIASARHAGRETAPRGRSVNVSLIDPAVEVANSGLEVACVRVRFDDNFGVPYEGVVQVMRTQSKIELVTRCLYPALLHDELFDYAHRELILSARLADD
jgi:hypothetical protein